jgi:hypothetical protein
MKSLQGRVLMSMEEWLKWYSAYLASMSPQVQAPALPLTLQNRYMNTEEQHKIQQSLSVNRSPDNLATCVMITGWPAILYLWNLLYLYLPVRSSDRQG